MTNPILETLALIDRPPGYLQLMRFCHQVESGEPVDQEILGALVVAFRELVDKDTLKAGQAAFASAMNLKGSAGRRKTDGEQQYTAALRSYLLEFEKGSASRAVLEIAREINKEESFVWRARRAHKDSAKSFAKYLYKVEREFKSIGRGIERLVESVQKKKD